jgi:hypothetical protein
VTEAGTVRLVLLLDTETVVLAVAALDRVTVQVDTAAEVSVEGEQASEVSVVSALNEIVAVLETPLSVAVMVADPSTVRVPAVAAKVAVDWPLATVTEADTVRLALLLAKVTTVLLEAVPESVVVQVEAAPGPNVAGLQLNEVSVVGGGELTVTVPPLATSCMAIPVLEAAAGVVT